LGIGDWGLGIGPNPQSPIPNPQSPIPNPHINIKIYLLIKYKNYICLYIKIINYKKNIFTIFYYNFRLSFLKSRKLFSKFLTSINLNSSGKLYLLQRQDNCISLKTTLIPINLSFKSSIFI